MNQHRGAFRCRGELSRQRVLDGISGARVVSLLDADGLVGNELGLDDERHLRADRLDLVEHGCERPIDQRDHSRRAHADGVVRRRLPLGDPREETRLKVEHALVGKEVAVSDVEGLVVDEQADDLAVGHVDQRLPGLRIAVRRFGVGEGHLLVDRVQV